jgi:hypothetical protein
MKEYDLPIGTKFMIKATADILVVDESKESCKGCFFDGVQECRPFRCTWGTRKDEKDVIFRKIEIEV